MVRRRSMVKGLANQLSHQQLGWQPQLLQWPPPPLMSAMHTLCNKMGGAVPRMPSLPQPEASSRRLSRLRRNLMKFAPQVPQVQQVAPAPALALTPAPSPGCCSVVSAIPGYGSMYQAAPLLPNWCRSSEQLFEPPAQTQAVLNRQRQVTSDISIQLKKQLQQLKRKQAQRELKSTFKPFNFGICASSFIEFLDRESTASESSVTQPKVPTISIVHRPQEKHVRANDFGYVQLAKQMSQRQPMSGRTKVTKLAKDLAKRRTSEKAPVSFKTDCSASSTTLINCSEAQAGSQENAQTQTQPVHPIYQFQVPTEQELNCLAANISDNLIKIRKLLFTESSKSVAMLPEEIHEMQLRNNSADPATLQVTTAAGCAPIFTGLAAPQQPELKPETELKLTPGQLELLQKLLQDNDQLHNRETKAAKKSRKPKRLLNLNKLFEANKLQCGDKSTNPLWNSLMQLVAHMCDDKEPSKDTERLSAGGRAQKQYSVYLMVTSDEEEDASATDEPSQPTVSRKPRPKMFRKQCTAPTDHLEPCVKQQQQSRFVCGKKRVCLRRWCNEVTSRLPPRRPLHWPKPQYVKGPVKRKKKRLPRGSGSRSSARSWWMCEQPSPYCSRRRRPSMLNPFLHISPAIGNYSRHWYR